MQTVICYGSMVRISVQVSPNQMVHQKCDGSGTYVEKPWYRRACKRNESEYGDSPVITQFLIHGRAYERECGTKNRSEQYGRSNCARTINGVGINEVLHQSDHDLCYPHACRESGEDWNDIVNRRIARPSKPKESYRQSDCRYHREI